MSEYKQKLDRFTQEEVRNVVSRNFDLLIHDLSCACELADKGRAWDVLAHADWTITEAFNGWYDAWLGGDSRA